MTARQRNALLIVFSIGIAFGGGAAWQFTQARQARAERDAARQELATVQQQLATQRMEAILAMAVVATQFGHHESARQLASEFFTALQQQAGTAAEPALAELLARRDAIITALSRAQPESAIEMANALTSFQRALGRQPTVPPPLLPDTAPDTAGVAGD